MVKLGKCFQQWGREGSLGNVSEFLIGSKKILQKFYEVRDLNAFLNSGRDTVSEVVIG